MVIDNDPMDSPVTVCKDDSDNIRQDNLNKVPVVEISLTPSINLPQQQNEIPFITTITIHNVTEKVLENVILSIHTDPIFLVAKEWHFDRINIDETRVMKDVDVTLSHVFLAERKEAIRATVTLTLKCEEGLITTQQSILVLTPEEWGGLSHMPELVAAFCLPNDPAIENILKKAAISLRQSKENLSLEGYQKKDPKRVYNQISAIYNAITSFGLDYACPPASFEQVGQKIRTPSRILDTGLATCLDLTLLMAACFEQCNLHPLILFTKGHSYVGCWLVEEDFSTARITDLQAIRKRQQLIQLIVIETTLLTDARKPGLKDAVYAGIKHLDDSANFMCAIDIKRARMNYIRPVMRNDIFLSLQSESSASFNNIEPELEDLENYVEFEVVDDNLTQKPIDRIVQWKKELLDLTRRNPLLNFKARKSSLSIFCNDLSGLVNLISSMDKIKFVALQNALNKNKKRSDALFEQKHQHSIEQLYAKQALAKGEFLVNLDDKELEGRLLELYRKAKNALEEGGENILFIAIGFLHWTESSSKNVSKAPLILIPVSIERKSIQSKFTLKKCGEEPILNPTLLEMLRHDFKINFDDDFKEKLSFENIGTNLTKVLQHIRYIIRDIQGWELVEEIGLSTFYFTKYLMWKDLESNLDLLKENPVVRHLIDTPKEIYRAQGEFPESHLIDKNYHPINTFCPLSADTYQMAAIYSAAEGKDFVLVGPPGTGKSQTITNMIVQLMAMGKTVLFVSEKMAALDVVYRRLQSVGLADFCLQLHSSKANKKDILTQLGNAWSAAGNEKQNKWEKNTKLLYELRNKLNNYPALLHQQFRNGLTPYRALGISVAHQLMPHINFEWPETNLHTEEELDYLRDFSRKVKDCILEVGNLKPHPFQAIIRIEWTQLLQNDFQNKVQNLLAATQELRVQRDTILESLSFPDIYFNHEHAEILLALIGQLKTLNQRPLAFVLNEKISIICDRLRELLCHVKSWQDYKNQLSVDYQDNGVSLNAEELLYELNLSCCDFYNKSGFSLEEVIAHFKIAEEHDYVVLEKIKNNLHKIVSSAKAWQQHKLTLSQGYRDNGAELDADELYRQWKLSDKKPWLFASFIRRPVLKKMKCVSLLEKEPVNENIEKDLLAIIDLKNEYKLLGQFELEARLWPNYWQNITTDYAYFEEVAQIIDRIYAFLSIQKNAMLGDFKVDQHILMNDLKLMINLRNEEVKIEELSDCTNMLGYLWQGTTTNINTLIDALDWVCKTSELIIKLSGSDGELLGNIRGSLARVLGEQVGSFRFSDQLEQRMTDFIDACNNFFTAKDKLMNIIELDYKHLMQSSDFSVKNQDTYLIIETTLNSWLANLNKLRQWYHWCKIRDEAEKLRLRPLIQSIESNQITPDSIPEVFEYSYCKWWLERIVSEMPILRDFQGAEHERFIDEFRDCDNTYLKLTQDYVRSIITGKIPSRLKFSTDIEPEWGILNRELEKKSRHRPLRELISALPTALTRLTPCLLMSPLSIAQYLSARSQRFDIVIFDEASQIPVWDAVGAIARGKQTIIVGDPKQLPPTRFGMRSLLEEDDDEERMEDLESVLDECLAARMPQQQLNWHYRSQHESLIYFSNHRYYKGSLITFPSPVAEDKAVSYQHVPDGIYEMGSGKVNRLEAQTVVDEVIRLLKVPTTSESEKSCSIGVVTFNQPQQKLIEDLLEQRRREDPELEQYFSLTQIEPIFIKNLENVQGDERDIIIFSLTYGPDLAGKVSMNFGPLNNKGGERRLNVAITRARRALKVIGTLRAEHIDLSRTQAAGVKDLKDFLIFAEQGTKALANVTSSPGGEAESIFEQEVARALELRGWQVHLQVGVSGYRLDLAVVDPANPGRYLAGIECDGAMYHSSATARDRDKLREHILRSLGWEIFRVWSTDWWYDSKRCLDKLNNKLVALNKIIS